MKKLTSYSSMLLASDLLVCSILLCITSKKENVRNRDTREEDWEGETSTAFSPSSNGKDKVFARETEKRRWTLSRRMLAPRWSLIRQTNQCPEETAGRSSPRTLGETRLRCISRNASDDERRKTTRPATQGVVCPLRPRGGNGIVSRVHWSSGETKRVQGTWRELTGENSATIATARACIALMHSCCTGCTSRCDSRRENFPAGNLSSRDIEKWDYLGTTWVFREDSRKVFEQRRVFYVLFEVWCLYMGNISRWCLYFYLEPWIKGEINLCSMKYVMCAFNFLLLSVIVSLMSVCVTCVRWIVEFIVSTVYWEKIFQIFFMERMYKVFLCEETLYSSNKFSGISFPV